LQLSIAIKTFFSNTRNYLLLSLSSIAIGLSLSKPLISLGLFGLFILWVVSGDLKNKIKAFYRNKIAVVISSIYLLTLIGLFYTTNFDFALDDVRRKIPLFFFPFFLSGFNPLTKKELNILLKVYLTGVLIATFWCFFVYLGCLDVVIVDVRDYSRFNSHIRFGLEIALAIFFSGYFIYKTPQFKNKILWVFIGLWFVITLYIFNLFSGTLVFVASLIIGLLVFGLTSTKKRFKIISILLFTGLIITVVFFVKNAISNYYACYSVAPLEEITFTSLGNKYQKDAHTDKSMIKENGYYIEKNIARDELSEAWNKRSLFDFNGEDLKGQLIRNTLIRFITSKGQRKDKHAIDNLTKKEIKAIESGVSNYKYLTMNEFSVRLHKIIWEYDSYVNGRDINGHSVLMRWEYWRTATRIIKNHLFVGVGTGDVQDAFNLQYENDSSVLIPKYRLRAHNQYLTYTVTFGIIGLAYFLFTLFYPIIKTKIYRNYLYLVFFSIVCLSMLTEDTLETIVGINFFVFFNTLFLLNRNYSEKTLS
jgi:hypothetical protein